MPYARSPVDGARIYYEIEGDGPPLLLHHGMTSGLDAWSLFGYRDTLVQHFQCIFMDARGHRMSDKPHDPNAYTRQHLVYDILAILDDLHLDQAHFWGYSLGGTAGIAMLVDAPDRLLSVVIGASHPFPQDAEQVTKWIELYRQGPEAFVAYLEQQNGPLELANRERTFRNDFDAIAAFMTARRDDPSYDESLLVGALQTTSVPCLLYIGSEDPSRADAERAARLHADIRYVEFEGLNHVQVSWRSDLTMPVVLRFLTEQAQHVVQADG